MMEQASLSSTDQGGGKYDQALWGLAADIPFMRFAPT